MDGAVVSLGVNSAYTKYASTETLISETASDDPKTYGSVMSSSTQNLGYRLRRRKEILGQRKRIVDIGFVLGMSGILLVILDCELVFNDIIGIKSMISNIFKISISITTIALLLSVAAYHATGLRLNMASSGFTDWRLLMSNTKWAKLIFEMFVCALHPFPFLDIDIDTVTIYSNKIEPGAKLPVSAILTITMFFRLYLVCRFTVVHSKLFLDPSVQSLGALSRVKINGQFVFRALMSSTPGYVLTAIMLTMFFVNSWTLRVCERSIVPFQEDSSSLAQTMWLTAVTFLTVGYGDIVPHSYCGRLIIGWSGLLGVGTMALSVAVLAKNLEQSRSEKYVHTFVQQVALDKMRKNCAANIIKQMIKIFKLKKAKMAYKSKEMLIQRSKLLKAIRLKKKASYMKTHLQEVTVGTVELYTNINKMHSDVDVIHEEQVHLKEKVSNIEQLAISMNEQLKELTLKLLETPKKKLSRVAP